jgi:hypothetical protein
VKVKILPTALEDLDRGRRFYARQRNSLGNYFLDALFSDIDSLELYAGIHIKVFDFHRLAGLRWVDGSYVLFVEPRLIGNLDVVSVRVADVRREVVGTPFGPKARFLV